MNNLSALSGAPLKQTFKRLSRGRLAQLDGRVYLPCLSDPVTISRDRWGIPSIEATNRNDLFRAQGFVHAQERLWQMEIHRRAAAGRLAAMVGDMGLETDRLSRTLGFARLAQATWDLTSAKMQEDIESYTAGVNSFLENGHPLPLEFSLLRHRPEPWTVLDSVSFGRMMAWILSHGFANKLTRAKLIDRVGPEAAAELELFYPETNPLTLPKGIEFNLLEADGMLRAAQGPFMQRNMENSGRGSNAWVVSGRRTASGSPILCNDMHLPIGVPSLWYVLQLNCSETAGQPALHVAGASLPGLPYVLVGHNRHIAWGATVSFVDNEDLFVERFSPGDDYKYEFEGQWRQAQVVEEKIEVRGRSAHHESVVITHHGPLISKVLPTNGQALALASRSLQANKSFDGFALLNEARGWDDFARAVQQIESPSLNLVYADDAGNIGYYVTGRAPIRSTGHGQVPVPGWTGDFEWTGDVPFEHMPHALNPEDGFVVTANNKIVADDYPYYLGSAWRNGYRARRIRDLLLENEKLSALDCRRMQGDLLSIPGQELVARLARLNPEDTDAAGCLELLRGWNGRLDAGSTGGIVYKFFHAELTRAVLQLKLGPSLAEDYLGAGPHPDLYPFGETYSQWITVLIRQLDTPNSLWLPTGAERDRLLESCLAKTMQEFRRLLGNDPEEWSWGKKHQLTFGHVLSAQPPLDRVFSVGPFVVGGDSDTVNQISISPEDSANNIAASYRQVFAVGDWDTALAMHAPGQSGHLASPHYADLSQPWLEGEYYELGWSQPSQERAAEHTLRLLPAMSGANES
jgi:penicillin amidase